MSQASATHAPVEAAAAAAAVAATTSKKAAKSAPKKTASSVGATKKPKPDHPTYQIMITEALVKLADGRKGISRQAVLKFVTSTYGIEPAHAKMYVNKELVKAVDSGHAVRTSAGSTGANGSFRLSAEAKRELDSSDDETAAAAEKPTRKQASRRAASPPASPPAKKARTVSDSKKKIAEKAAASKAKKGAAAAKHEK